MSPSLALWAMLLAIPALLQLGPSSNSSAQVSHTAEGLLVRVQTTDTLPQSSDTLLQSTDTLLQKSTPIRRFLPLPLPARLPAGEKGRELSGGSSGGSLEGSLPGGGESEKGGWPREGESREGNLRELPRSASSPERLAHWRHHRRARGHTRRQQQQHNGAENNGRETSQRGQINGPASEKSRRRQTQAQGQTHSVQQQQQQLELNVKLELEPKVEAQLAPRRLTFDSSATEVERKRRRKSTRQGRGGERVGVAVGWVRAGKQRRETVRGELVASSTEAAALPVGEADNNFDSGGALEELETAGEEPEEQQQQQSQQDQQLQSQQLLQSPQQQQDQQQQSQQQQLQSQQQQQVQKQQQPNETGPIGKMCETIEEIVAARPSAAVGIIFGLNYVVIFAFGLLGNIVTLYVLYCKGTSKCSVQDILIGNLACSDIMLCLFAVPITPKYLIMDGYWTLGSALCKVVSFAQSTSVYMSTYSLICIGYIRYRLIVHPLGESMSKRTAILSCLGTWCVGILVTLPYMLQVRLSPEDCAIKFCDEAWANPAYRFVFSLFTAFFQFMIPLASVGFFNKKIYSSLDGRNKEAHSNSKSATLLNKKSNLNKNSKSNSNKNSSHTQSLTANPKGGPRLAAWAPCFGGRKEAASKEASAQAAVLAFEGATGRETVSPGRASNKLRAAPRQRAAEETLPVLHEGRVGAGRGARRATETAIVPLGAPLGSAVASEQESSGELCAGAGGAQVQLRGTTNGKQNVIAIKEQRQREKERRMRKANNRLIFVVVIFAHSWLPLNLFNIAQDYSQGMSTWPYLTNTFLIVHQIACSSVCWNPILYAWMSETYRQDLRQALPGCLVKYFHCLIGPHPSKQTKSTAGNKDQQHCRFACLGEAQSTISVRQTSETFALGSQAKTRPPSSPLAQPKSQLQRHAHAKLQPTSAAQCNNGATNNSCLALHEDQQQKQQQLAQTPTCNSCSSSSPSACSSPELNNRRPASLPEAAG